MGRIPQKGESLKYGNIQYIVQDTDQKSIKEVMVVLPEEAETL
jgi:CBS domain containing-hemolysin-like protein